MPTKLHPKSKKKRKRPDVEVGDYKVESEGEESNQEIPPAVAKARAQLSSEATLRFADSVLRLVPRDEVEKKEVFDFPGLAPKAACLTPASSCNVVQALLGAAAPLPKAKGVITKEQLDKERAAREAARGSDRDGGDDLQFREEKEEEEGSDSQGSLDSFCASPSPEKPGEKVQPPGEPAPIPADDQDCGSPEVLWL